MRFTAEQMSKMGTLVATSSYSADDTLRQLLDEAEAAGVYSLAVSDGLTFEQWDLVRHAHRTLRNAVLALEPQITVTDIPDVGKPAPLAWHGVRPPEGWMHEDDRNNIQRPTEDSMGGPY